MQYLRINALDDALALLSQGRHRVVAGCTDVLPGVQGQVLRGPVLDITAIAELRGIRRHDTGWTIGACTTWTDLAKADLPPAFRSLQTAARAVGGIQIQNRGTIAGNLCNASPAADGVPPLLTLDAEVELRSAGTRRRLPLSVFLTGPRRTALRPGEMVSAVHIPEGAARGQSAFGKLGARSSLVISIAMVAARIVVTDGRVSDAALAVGACSPVAVRLPDIEAALIGKVPGEESIADAQVAAALAPIDDVRADASYRAAAAAELLRRTIADLVEVAAA